MPPYSSDAREEWEAKLFEVIRECVKEVWREAGRPRNVYIAVDGVVPMAKIRQQRVRRFKSAWIREMKGENGWDSNSITPGTEFMKNLGKDLRAFCKENGRGWEVSGADEGGEGEHKIMRWLRCDAGAGAWAGKTVVVYGLDADLILLGMLASGQVGAKLYLMREKQEFERGGSGAGGSPEEQEYTFMNLQEFQKRLGVKEGKEILNYIALMNLMGNDFLPHSLTHTLKDDGHDCLMKEFKSMQKGGKWLIEGDVAVCKEVFYDICKRWGQEEKKRMIHMIHKKREQAKRGVGKGMEEMEGLPLEWAVEEEIMNEEDLREDWEDIYASWCTGGDRETLCREYVKGYEWILSYYQGHTVDMHWAFPSWLPPLWSWLAAGGERGRGDGGHGLEGKAEKPIQPEEQLAMVLPLASWDLVKRPDLRKLPGHAPQYWPTKFGFVSAGRKWLWECEAKIPVLTAGRLRQLLSEAG